MACRLQQVKRLLNLILLISLIVPAAALLLIGPRNAENLPPELAKDCVIVDYWEKWTGREAEMMNMIVDDFNRTVGRDKNIYVRYVSISGVDRKTMVATAAGVPPDLAGLFDGQLVQFAAQNALEPLENLATAHGITAATYKPVYWKGCTWHGHLWGLISTPMAMALHYNKLIFLKNAAALRQVGLDPTRAPATIDQLDRYAQVLTQYEPPLIAGPPRIKCSGYMPLEPGWYIDSASYFFGGSLVDVATSRLTFCTPANIAAYDWIRSYSARYTPLSISNFRSSVGAFDSPQNSFLTGRQVMEQQGPWMANTIFNQNSSMSQFLVPFALEQHLPRVIRPFNYQWHVAPFPCAVPGLDNVTFVGFDILVIPRGAAHPAQAFEFLAYVNRQDVMEKLCSLHCKNSPLASVSASFFRTHPNPFIEVFDTLAASPNAHGVPQLPIWPEIHAELSTATEAIYLLAESPADALRHAEAVCRRKLDHYREIDAARQAKQPNSQINRQPFAP